MLPGVDVAMAAFEIAFSEDMKKNIGGIFGEGNGFRPDHILVSKRLIFFLAVISSSLVARRRIDMYSANIRYNKSKKSNFSSVGS
jgi:hypothetical protein